MEILENTMGKSNDTCLCINFLRCLPILKGFFAKTKESVSLAHLVKLKYSKYFAKKPFDATCMKNLFTDYDKFIAKNGSLSRGYSFVFNKSMNSFKYLGEISEFV